MPERQLLPEDFQRAWSHAYTRAMETAGVLAKDMAAAASEVSASADQVDAATTRVLTVVGAVPGDVRGALDGILPKLDDRVTKLSDAIVKNSGILAEINAAQTQRVAAFDQREATLTAKESAIAARESAVAARESTLAADRRVLDSARQQLAAATHAFTRMNLIDRIRYPRTAKPAAKISAPAPASKPIRPAAPGKARAAGYGDTGFDMAHEVEALPPVERSVPKVGHEAERMRAGARVRERREHQMYVDAEASAGARREAWWSSLLRADRVSAAIAVLIAGVAAAYIARTIFQRFAG